MSSAIKGLIFVVLGILFLAWFGYEALAYFSRGNAPTEDNAVIELTLMVLKLVAAISFFISAIGAFRRKN